MEVNIIGLRIGHSESIPAACPDHHNQIGQPLEGTAGVIIAAAPSILRPLHQLRQLRHVERDAAGFIAREQAGSSASAWFILIVDVAEGLPVGVPDYDALMSLGGVKRRSGMWRLATDQVEPVGQPGILKTIEDPTLMLVDVCYSPRHYGCRGRGR
jgi:hypothetical protein